MYTPYIKLYGMLVSEQFLFWLYLHNWAGSALWKFLYLKMALMSLIRAQNSCGKQFTIQIYAANGWAPPNKINGVLPWSASTSGVTGLAVWLNMGVLTFNRCLSWLKSHDKSRSSWRWWQAESRSSPKSSNWRVWDGSHRPVMTAIAARWALSSEWDWAVVRLECQTGQ